jgi:hypothetical protein
LHIGVSIKGGLEMGTGKIFDFLYHDARRVGSLLAQLDDVGLLTAVRRNEGNSIANKGTLEGKAEGGVPFIGKAGGGTSLTRESSKTGQLERTFDPLWQNARNFVHYASENSVSISNARIGQIVTITGKITIVDFDLLKQIMASLMDQSSNDGNRQERRAAQKNQNAGSSKEPPIADIFGLFPYKIQMTVEGAYQAWATVNEEFLVTEASDLVLKYGGTLDGEWTVVGIADALPSYFDGQLVGNLNFENGVEAFGMKLTKAMAPMARVLLGRPSEAYGLTPLVVYRDIG